MKLAAEIGFLWRDLGSEIIQKCVILKQQGVCGNLTWKSLKFRGNWLKVAYPAVGGDEAGLRGHGARVYIFLKQSNIEIGIRKYFDRKCQM
ncbi:hypothetical protein E4633_04285 [Geomonas terrae]|uniref:Uncharacterized protein n=1 Tax=Geomonas terrae TaxID=2562681 RepID=A0A4S1CLM9_9BACT|nr:hypothetical protein [Geomonas terrae]TGU74688.1 hypothetical protein E4633_04285 [Geomonas terrae]